MSYNSSYVQYRTRILLIIQNNHFICGSYKHLYDSFKNRRVCYTTPMKVEIFWCRIRNMLKSNGITQEVLAKKCGIPVGTLKGWMAGKLILEDSSKKCILH